MPGEEVEHRFVVTVGVTLIVHQKRIAKLAAIGEDIIEDTSACGMFGIEVEIVVWVHVGAVEEGAFIWDVETRRHIAKE